MSEERENPTAASPAPSADDAVLASTPAPAAVEAGTEAVSLPPPAPAVAVEPEKPPDLLSGAVEQSPSSPAPLPGESPTSPAPETYAWQPFTLPDGMEHAQFNEERLGGLREAIIAADLSPQDRGQRLLDLHIAEMRAYDDAVAERQNRVWQDTQVRWKQDFAGDPELGGSGSVTSMQRANSAIMRLLSNDTRLGQRIEAPADLQPGQPNPRSDRGAFMDALRVTGMINHPEMVRFLNRVDNWLREPAAAAAAPGPLAVPRDIGARRMSAQAGNPGSGRARMRDMYTHERSTEVFNGSRR